MSFKKWEKEFRLSVLAAKFAEEAGEVCGAIADRAFGHQSFNEKGDEHILEEISHARFFLDQIERRVRINQL